MSGKVAGYYTLAAAGIPLADMPPDLAKKLPRYPSVPVAWLGRLAGKRGATRLSATPRVNTSPRPRAISRQIPLKVLVFGKGDKAHISKADINAPAGRAAGLKAWAKERHEE